MSTFREMVRIKGSVYLYDNSVRDMQKLKRTMKEIHKERNSQRKKFTKKEKA